MAEGNPDQREREELCQLLDALGPDAPTLVDGWTAKDLAAHLVVRERDFLAGPCMVLPGPFARFAERRRSDLAADSQFAWLVHRIESGPPIGFFRLRWVRALANLNEYFVHHEDLRRANGCGPRSFDASTDAALWRNVRLSGGYLSRRLHGAGLDLEWLGTDACTRARRGEPRAALRGAPGELLLFLFGRGACSAVEVTGSVFATSVVRDARFGM